MVSNPQQRQIWMPTAERNSTFDLWQCYKKECMDPIISLEGWSKLYADIIIIGSRINLSILKSSMVNNSVILIFDSCFQL